MDALALLARYAATRARVRFYAAGEQVPLDGVVPARGGTPSSTTTGGWSGSRTSCACWSRCGRRCAAGRSTSPAPARWRNPEDDLPGDFEAAREVHYAAIRASRWTRPRSSPTCAERLTDGADPLGRRPGRRRPPAGCGSPAAAASPGSRCPSWRPLPEPRMLTAVKDEVDPPLGHPRPAGRAEGRRLPDRLHRPSSPRSPRTSGSPASRAAPPAAAVPVRPGHEHGDPGDRGHRGARRDRGRAAARAPALHHPRQPAPRDHPAGQRHLRRAGPGLVGHRHGVRVATRRSSGPGSRT